MFEKKQLIKIIFSLFVLIKFFGFSHVYASNKINLTPILSAIFEERSCQRNEFFGDWNFGSAPGANFEEFNVTFFSNGNGTADIGGPAPVLWSFSFPDNFSLTFVNENETGLGKVNFNTDCSIVFIEITDPSGKVFRGEKL